MRVQLGLCFTRSRQWAIGSIVAHTCYQQILGWIQAGRLVVDPLISHVLSPGQAQAAYDGLTNRKDEYSAVVFDWSRL